MALFTEMRDKHYSRAVMPKPVEGDGPWKAAIAYWLDKHDWSAADLARHVKMPENTVSRAVRGWHVNTRTLERIADGFGVTLEEVLVSPARRSTEEQQRLVIQDAVERALKNMARPPSAPADPMEDSINASMRAIQEEQARRDARAPSAKSRAAKRGKR